MFECRCDSLVSLVTVRGSHCYIIAVVQPRCLAEKCEIRGTAQSLIEFDKCELLPKGNETPLESTQRASCHFESLSVVGLWFGRV